MPHSYLLSCKNIEIKLAIEVKLHLYRHAQYYTRIYFIEAKAIKNQPPQIRGNIVRILATL